jgi:3-methylcrotonyl-CoA carboxylase beta subunit
MKNSALKEVSQQILQEEVLLAEGGGTDGKERQKRLGRLTARERLHLLLDKNSEYFELGLWAAWKMYSEWGELPGAGVITGIGHVSGKQCMLIINDATVKAGAMFPQSVKKVLRAQRIAFQNRLPILYLVDSSGVFLPLQEDIFPDEDDFGRIFRNNAIISAEGIPQFSAIMGNCIAGGGYLPVLCDKLLMTEGSGLYLAGPALVRAAIGQIVDPEELGGAKMHAEISGTVDFLEPNDETCIKKLRSLVAFLPRDEIEKDYDVKAKSARKTEEIYEIVKIDSHDGYDMHHLLDCFIDAESFQEFKADYGKSLITGYGKIFGMPVGIVANQRLQTKSVKGEMEIGGVIYPESADKAARFVMDCNQMKLPLIFFQDVMGFMVGKQAEQTGIIRHGAKLVSAVSNSIVPKITVIIGNSFGAGNYALCGKAYDPNFIMAWPNARYAVMGADQAADTLFSVQKKAAERRGNPLSNEDSEKMHHDIKNRYEEQMDIRYGAARGWVDAIIPPHETRNVLGNLLKTVKKITEKRSFHAGVFQV